jgi:drug/metabolite transporter (DMT)-like permease
MNDKGLWPIHLIFFGTMLALVFYAIKLFFEELAQNPILIILVVGLLILCFLTRLFRRKG